MSELFNRSKFRPGRYQSALGLMLFLLSTVAVLALLLTAYRRRTESTVPEQYFYQLDDSVDPSDMKEPDAATDLPTE